MANNCFTIFVAGDANSKHFRVLVIKNILSLIKIQIEISLLRDDINTI